jgi:hypothetical protein
VATQFLSLRRRIVVVIRRSSSLLRNASRHPLPNNYDFVFCTLFCLVLPGFVGVKGGESQAVSASLPALRSPDVLADGLENKAWQGSSAFGKQRMSS